MQSNNNNASRKINNNVAFNRPNTSYKMFCKVCQDSGKTEKEYTNHNVRDLKNGNTTCPTLLAQQCKNCFKHGHTVKYCKRVEPVYQVAKKAEPVKKSVAERSKNVFLAFELDSEDEDKPTTVEQFPTLTKIEQSEKKPVLNYSRLLEPQVTAVKPVKVWAQPIPIITAKKQIPKDLDWATADSDLDDYYSEDEEEDITDGSAW